ncbi:unnamed protein product [Rotaria magnacalcarata]|nr:unnamed protein product [Rotaria magnacalcarata]CAF3925390.1 unnamed protein product [Rotaria magnacalcarata]
MADGSESQSNSHNNTLLSSSSSSPPIPVLHSYTDTPTAYEEYMVHRINAIIGGLFTQPDYQTPYRFTFCWIFKDESELLDQQSMQQQQQQQIKKKTSRGNRKLQRFRRKCRARGMNENSIVMSTNINEKETHPIDFDQREEQNKMNLFSNSQSNHNQNVLQNHERNERSLMVNVKTNSIRLTHSNPKQRYAKMNNTIKKSPIPIDKWKTSHQLKPNYLKMSNHCFMDLLYMNLNSDQKQIKNCLIRKKIMQSIRRHAHLVNNKLVFELEQDYWETVVNSAAVEIVWLSKTPKDITKINSINWAYPRTMKNF